ncbi:dynein light chain roadblock-type 1 [Phyllostomus discolor]|uniref:Dynein light chain roadblock-type 1 n=1 Tax=Phyllostomus discolor TaxID=89673 RepID=A0A834DPP5_9CHIR|nr:dynein light chain roadblock-type 1 [Phyllostomus discolor]
MGKLAQRPVHPSILGLLCEYNNSDRVSWKIDLFEALKALCVVWLSSSPRLCETDVAEVEETLKRLQSQKGVQGIIVVNTEGIPIKSTMDNPTTTQYANLMHNFILKARSTVREIDPQNDLTFLRIRSKKNEIMVAPDKDYFLIVIQNPTE